MKRRFMVSVAGLALVLVTAASTAAMASNAKEIGKTTKTEPEIQVMLGGKEGIIEGALTEGELKDVLNKMGISKAEQNKIFENYQSNKEIDNKIQAILKESANLSEEEIKNKINAINADRKVVFTPEILKKAAELGYLEAVKVEDNLEFTTIKPEGVKTKSTEIKEKTTDGAVIKEEGIGLLDTDESKLTDKQLEILKKINSELKTKSLSEVLEAFSDYISIEEPTK